MKIEKSSFRDPAGFVFQKEGDYFRAINITSVNDFLQVHQSGALAQLVKENKLISYELLTEEQKNQIFPQAGLLLKLKKIDFLSYSYEWSFSMLQQAALLQLETHLIALDYNLTLIDATPFNIQFINSNPVFIDHLSFRPYQEGDIWWGHKQFCQMYLAPLLLQHYRGINFQPWVQSNMGEIALSDLVQVLSCLQKLNPKVFFHVFLQTKLNRPSLKKNALVKQKKINLSKQALINLLHSMHAWIKKLKPFYGQAAYWSSYEKFHSYSSESLDIKKSFITEFCRTTQLEVLWDLGCNKGNYAELALENSVKKVIGFDNDPRCIELAYQLSSKKQLNFLPLCINIVNPSPSLGWNLEERKSLLQRKNANGLLALALIHHLRIRQQIPLLKIIEFLFSLAPQGIIEFIPKTDYTVKQLLRNQKDIYDDYTLENFIEILKTKANILKHIKLLEPERFLFWYQLHEK